MKFLKKQQKEQGRSMVEMLGVLAIIGVLSIGGIAGYTMAMNRYKANEILDMASKLSIAAQTAGAATGNVDIWNEAMRHVANEMGLNVSAPHAYLRNGLLVEGLYETTYHVRSDGYVASYVGDDGISKAIDSITGIDGAGQGDFPVFQSN